jgi:SAM-dependent methyltransferase
MILKYDGERLIPDRAEAYSFWEHIYRYRFAASLVRGKSVLDIACGEGYGTGALAAVARSVVGVDVSPTAVAHARAKYHVDVRVGSAEDIPLADGSVEVVVSFETIEHLRKPAVFIRECHRVLAPGGRLVISSPNREVYSPDGTHNSFHLSELTEEELNAVLHPYFTPRSWYGQKASGGAWWRPRDLFADGSPWMATRAGRGLRRLVRRVLCPSFRYPPADADRRNPVGAVLKRDLPGGRWVNPFAVRPRTFGAPDRPAYLLSVSLRNDLAVEAP